MVQGRVAVPAAAETRTRVGVCPRGLTAACSRNGTGLESRLSDLSLCFCHSPTTFNSFFPPQVAMSGLLSSPSLSVPTLTIETSSSELKVRVGRTRSSSIVKVETVGEDSQEEGLDQNLYDNVNAEWVNRKGTSAPAPLRLRFARPAY